MISMDQEHRLKDEFDREFVYTSWPRIGCSILEEAFPFYKVYAKQHFYEIVDAGHDPFGYDLQDLWLDVFQRPWAMPTDQHKIIDDLAQAVENGDLFVYVEEEPFEWQAPGRFAGDEADASAHVNAPLQALIDEENDDRSFWQKTKDVSASVWESTKIAASESVDHPGEFGKGVFKGIGNLPADAWNLAVEQVKSDGPSAIHANVLDWQALEAYKQGDLEKANALAQEGADIHEAGYVDDLFPIENPAQQGGAIASVLVPVGAVAKAGAGVTKAPRVEKLSDAAGKIPGKKIRPASLADAGDILKNRRKQIAAQGYQPKYTDAELTHLAQHGDIGNERFQVRFMEARYLNDRNTPDKPLSGKMGMVMKGETGEGAKYWSTSFDQIEDADSDPKLISEKLGLEYDPTRKYAMVVVDTEKSTPLTGVKSVPATFEKVGEFANTELPKQFSKDFTDKAMTPEFQAEYAKHYNAAVESGDLPDLWSRDTDAFQDYLQSTDLPLEEQKLYKKRMEMHDQIGNNQDYLGNGLTKDLNPNSPNEFGAVETLNFERKTINLKELHDAGAITIIKDLRPL